MVTVPFKFILVPTLQATVATFLMVGANEYFMNRSGLWWLVFWGPYGVSCRDLSNLSKLVQVNGVYLKGPCLCIEFYFQDLVLERVFLTCDSFAFKKYKVENCLMGFRPKKQTGCRFSFCSLAAEKRHLGGKFIT